MGWASHGCAPSQRWGMVLLPAKTARTRAPAWFKLRAALQPRPVRTIAAYPSFFGSSKAPVQQTAWMLCTIHPRAPGARISATLHPENLTAVNALANASCACFFSTVPTQSQPFGAVLLLQWQRLRPAVGILDGFGPLGRSAGQRYDHFPPRTHRPPPLLRRRSACCGLPCSPWPVWVPVRQR